MLIKSLYQSYTDIDAEYTATEAKLEALTEQRSKAVEAIAKIVAPKKQITLPNGEIVSIVCRVSKKAPNTGKETWFFRGAKKDNAVDLSYLMEKEEEELTNPRMNVGMMNAAQESARS